MALGLETRSTAALPSPRSACSLATWARISPRSQWQRRHVLDHIAGDSRQLGLGGESSECGEGSGRGEDVEEIDAVAPYRRPHLALPHGLSGLEEPDANTTT